MLMDEKFVKDRLGLDWDNISYRQALNRFHKFIEVEKPLRASLSMSPLKGYHVRAWFKQPRDTFDIRYRWCDDWNRLFLDWVRSGVYDVLWFRKTLQKMGKEISFEETPISEYNEETDKGKFIRKVL